MFSHSHLSSAVAWIRGGGEPGHEERVTVLEGDEYGNRRGIPLKVKLKRTDRQRRGVAEQIRAGGVKSANAAVLNDYRHWVNHIGGLDLGYE